MNHDVAFLHEKTREERDAEGWANAIVISDSDDEDVPVASLAAPPVASAAAAVLLATPPAAASSSSTGKRPIIYQPDAKPDVDEKPDIKRFKPDDAQQPAAAAAAAVVPYHAPYQPPQPVIHHATDLEDLSGFTDPIKGQHAPSRRCGHFLLKLTANTYPGDPTDHIRIGTGNERSSLERLNGLGYTARVDDGTVGQQVLGAIKRLANPANTRPQQQYNRYNRFAYQQGGHPLVEIEWQPKLPWNLKKGKPPVEVRLDVWLRPEIFDLRISGWHSAQSCFYDVWLLMNHITPMKPFIETPRPPPVQGDAVLAPCGAATAPNKAVKPKPNAHAFTLAGLMRALESAGYPEAMDPAGLALTLYPFQRQTLQWMIDRETQPGGLNALFWREHPSEGATKFFYNEMAGELRGEALPIVTGGFLCEEMGLGKTVEMCALILANPYTQAAAAAGRTPLKQPRDRFTGYAADRLDSKATLIVVPVVLLKQWQAEIKKIGGGKLKVIEHHTTTLRMDDEQRDALLNADIVLTTYEVLRAEVPWAWPQKFLLQPHWWRVVLDESQKVPKPAGAASAMTAIAKSLEDLSRTHSWCMSGTPVGSVVDDLLGQLIFLGVEPYCSRGDNGDAFWEREVSGRWKAKDPDALEVVHDLLGQIMMRHSKAQTQKSADGQRTALVALPQKTEEVVMLPLRDPSERAIYGELERFCREDFLAGEACKLALTKAQAALATAQAALQKAQSDGEDAPSIDKHNKTIEPLRKEVEALRKESATYRREDLILPRDLQLAACHISTLNLDAASGLEKKLAGRALRLPKSAALVAAAAEASSSPAGGATLLRSLLASRSAGAESDAAAARLRSILDDSNKQRCGLCATKFGIQMPPEGAAGSSSSGGERGKRVEPRLTLCGHLFCTDCLSETAKERGDDACPECHTADSGLNTSTLLHTPLGAENLAQTDAAAGRISPDIALPPVEAAAWEIKKPPPASRLADLLVWRCDGAPCHDGAGKDRKVAAAGVQQQASALNGIASSALRSNDAASSSSSRASKNAKEKEAAEAAKAAAASERMERSVTIDVDGLHFCSQLCAEGKFKRSLVPYCTVCQESGHSNNGTYIDFVTRKEKNGTERQVQVEKFLHPERNASGQLVTIVERQGFDNKIKNGPKATSHCIVGDVWTGTQLVGMVFATQTEAIKTFKETVRGDPSYHTGSQWPGEPLYPNIANRKKLPTREAELCKLCVRPDGAFPNLSLFPAGAPSGAFLAHMDAAGAPRSYGKHWPFHTSTKVAAVLEEVERIRKNDGTEKVVVFSDGKDVLDVLWEATRRARGDGSVALIKGDTGFDERMNALSKFQHQAGCHVLLLSVGACASGLTLTHANHCILLDLQSHEGKELQLVNRVWRIGQTKEVTIKRFVAQGTIEERMLHLRKRTRGLLATEDEVETMAVSSVEADESSNKGGKEKSAAAGEQAVRESDLRYLYGA